MLKTVEKDRPNGNFCFSFGFNIVGPSYSGAVMESLRVVKAEGFGPHIFLQLGDAFRTPRGRAGPTGMDVSLGRKCAYGRQCFASSSGAGPELASEIHGGDVVDGERDGTVVNFRAASAELWRAEFTLDPM